MLDCVDAGCLIGAFRLCVHIQRDLKWTKQVDEVKSRLKTRLKGLSKTKIRSMCLPLTSGSR